MKKLYLLLLGMLCSIGVSWGETVTIQSGNSSQGDEFSYSNLTAYSYDNNYWAKKNNSEVIAITSGSNFTFTNVNGVTITDITVKGVAQNNKNQSSTITISDGVNSISTGSINWANRQTAEANITSQALSNVNTLSMAEGATYTVSNNGYNLGIILIITYSASSGSGGSSTPTTHYTYLKNTMNWSSAYAYFLGSNSYWDNTNGSGSNNRDNGVAMTYDDETGLWKCETTQNSGYVVFVKDQQDNYDNFHNTEAIYCNNDFVQDKVIVPTAQTGTATHNGTTYYKTYEYNTLAEASGTGYYLAGSFNNWEPKGNEFALKNSVLTYSVDLSANTNYTFKVYNHGLAYGNAGTMTSTCTWTMSSSAANCTLTTGYAGTYTFNFNTSNNELTVTYPTEHTWKLHIWVGPSNSDWGEYTFTKKAGEESCSIAYYTLALPKVGEHDFELITDGTYYKNSGTMNSSNCTNWTFTTGASRGKIDCSKPGNYIFKVDFTNANCPVVSVTYPGIESMFENYFTCSQNNNSFYNISGNNATNKGSVTVTTANGSETTLSTCLKMESSTSIQFNAPAACKLKLVFVESAGTIKIDGDTKTALNGVITTEITAGSHTLTKDGSHNLFYINLYDFKISVSSAGYTTFCSAYDFVVPENDVVYYASAVSHDAITFTALAADTKVKAGDGLLIKGAGDHTFAYTTGATALGEDNKLVGVLTATDMSAISNAYILALDNGVAAFCPVSGGTLAAGKAYLVRPAAGSAPLRIVFETEGEQTATDIEAIEAADEAVKFIENGQIYIRKNGVVYTVLGQVVR